MEAGGAERMAVNYANALSRKIEFSGLIATRREGLLKNQLDKNVAYQFLNKKKLIDLKALFKTRSYIKKHKIDLMHAHSSSFFLAMLVKCLVPRVKIIWHDHYGISQDLEMRKNLGLKIGSLFFTGSIAVNSSLKKWAESYLWCKNVVFLPNFIEDVIYSNEIPILKGNDGKRIVCVANLRPQKNHELLINVAHLIKERYPEWTFHFFGKDFEDDHSEKIKKLIDDLKLEQSIFLYGTVNNVGFVLKQCDIAVLPSLSEGLPLAILEYGLYKKAVIATNVGQISKIITSEKKGLLVESNDIKQFSESIIRLIKNSEERAEMGLNLYNVIESEYSQKSIIRKYLIWLNSLTNFALKISI
ncbi:glycosyltransferase family 4 protein [Flavobacterium sp. KACC 22761]|uniref:glycosyltransferase family 4 protein n=1 Tax=Flavobacterium sp. KACC 22761 TaxID=3092665 RepID=UPI002A754131|nr:glycosyltransferase family 4 protein [Flavobacterium sp. KACC 22761]WPO79480.1 glycosyltransferase family 4 protein [Flavobacterium sp. KACC 22761]